MISEIHARLAASLGEDRLRRLHRSRVAIVGTGQLGGLLVAHLAMLQVPQVLIDPGVVEPPNLGNQGFPVAALGAPKVTARAAQIAAINPSCPVQAFPARIEDLGLGALAGVDLLLTAPDGRAARVASANVARRLGIPMLDAALDGSGRHLLGTVSCYEPRTPGSACYACKLDDAALAAIAREGRGAGCPSWRDERAPATPPTLALSAFAAIVAGHQLLWALRLLLGEGAGLVSRQLQILADGEARLRSLALPPGRRCRFPHAPLAPLAPLAAGTVGDLLATARADLGTEPEALLLHDRTIVFGLACPACGGQAPAVRLRHAFSDTDVRCPCGEPERVPIRLGDRLDTEEARALAGLSWRAFGLPAGDVVTARAGDGERHYLVDAREAA